VVIEKRGDAAASILLLGTTQGRRVNMSKAPKPVRRKFSVTLKVVIEHLATITVTARDQAEADRKAFDAYNRDVYTVADSSELGLPQSRWSEPTPYVHDPEIDPTFRCVDCGVHCDYFMVSDELWAASGMAPNGGMLCLTDLERRIGRQLTLDDFTALFPAVEKWRRHLEARNARAAE
jgi:hypothetical protein